MDQQLLFEILLKNSTDSIYFKDLESRFIMVNPTCAKGHGWPSPEANIGKTDFDIFSKEHAEKAFADEQVIIKTGKPLGPIEEKLTWPDGRITWVSTKKLPLRSDDGAIVGTYGISRDITDRKLAEDRARRYAEQIRIIKEEMEEEVRMAGKLQKNFCPSSYPSFPAGASPEDNCVEMLYSFNLNQQVTGDYCAITRVSSHEVGLFICDVSGIGVRAALGTALIRGVRQEISGLGREPAAYLRRMNELLMHLVNKEGLRLDVSACYMVLDVRSGSVKLANAGHPMPLLFGEYSTAWLMDDSAGIGPPLADMETPEYVTLECAVEPGNTIVMMTDGLFNVANNMDDLYGKKRLLDSAQSWTGEPLADIFSGLEGDALAFAKGGTFDDDVCLVGIELKQLMIP